MRRRDFLAVASAAAVAPGIGGCRANANSPGSRVFPDLYDCEGCEGTLERDPAKLSWSTQIGTGEDRGEPLLLTGTVFAADGRTAARDVVIYAHHTNSDGLYANGTSETLWSRRHGRLRAWAKTDAEGRYEFRTIKPAPYPSRDNPAHVHLMLKEPGERPYWIDDVVFAGHFGVDASYRSRRENRGGSGIVTLAGDRNGWRAVRNIVLERHPT